MQTQKKILLVDDESAIRRTLSLGLSQRGYETELCIDGVSALLKMNTLSKSGNTPAAVVLDIQLPDIMGTKLARIINFKYPEIPIILITGYSNRLNPNEIEDLRVRALLNKPVNSDELADWFETAEKDAQPTEFLSQKPAVSASTYVMLKLNESRNFFENYRKLYFMENVLYCDATKGEFDIVILIQSESIEHNNDIIKNKIKALQGIEQMDVLHLEAPILSETLEDIIQTADDALSDDYRGELNVREMSNQVCAYILLDVEEEKLEQIYPVLHLNEKVVYCDYTRGSYNLVVFVHGSYYNDIDKFIETHLSNMDGVLRVKKFPVLNLMGM